MCEELNLDVRGDHHDPDHPPYHHPHVICPLLWYRHQPWPRLHRGQHGHQPNEPLRHPHRPWVSEHQESGVIPGIQYISLFVEYSAAGICSICVTALTHWEYLQPGLDCEARIPRIVVSTVSPEPCPSDTSDTTCTSIQSDSSQSSAASWTSGDYCHKWK